MFQLLLPLVVVETTTDGNSSFNYSNQPIKEINAWNWLPVTCMHHHSKLNRIQCRQSTTQY